jgi:hypothetical protein
VGRHVPLPEERRARERELRRRAVERTDRWREAQHRTSKLRMQMWLARRPDNLDLISEL